MPRKRKLRIAIFVLANLLLLNLPFIFGTIMLYLEDDCESCATLNSSNSIAEATKRKTLISAYRIIKDAESDAALKNIPGKIEFWEEQVQWVLRNGSTASDDTLLLWSSPNPDKIKFKLFDKDHFIDIGMTWGYSSLRNQFKDTIILGIFKEEEVSQGNFIYIKEL